MLRVISGLGPPDLAEEGEPERAVLAEAVWLDLLAPSEDERAAVERATGLRVPSEHEITEIESSSRLSMEDGVLTLSTPLLARDRHDTALHAAAIGFVLSEARLLTLRYHGSGLIDSFAAHWRRPGGRPAGMEPFVGLLEAITDKFADTLEQIGAELDKMSAEVFREKGPHRRAKERDRFLRATLAEIGRTGTLLSQVRDGLLGLSRIVHYVTETARSWTEEGQRMRLKTVARDLASLTDHDAQLGGKVQFLLDATLGFISIEQNNGLRVLTVVSVIGIPPTLIASIYGMNFKIMPELNWRYGYPYALVLMALSVIVPMVWFRRKGWV